jgi:hypothetical protein
MAAWMAYDVPRVCAQTASFTASENCNGIAARWATVIVPSPLAGEGSLELQRVRMGEGLRSHPSPILSFETLNSPCMGTFLSRSIFVLCIHILLECIEALRRAGGADRRSWSGGAARPTETRARRTRGACPAWRLGAHNLVFGGPWKSDHDAVMRIGGEAPWRRAHSLPRHEAMGWLRVTAASDRLGIAVRLGRPMPNLCSDLLSWLH